MFPMGDLCVRAGRPEPTLPYHTTMSAHSSAHMYLHMFWGCMLPGQHAHKGPYHITVPTPLLESVVLSTHSSPHTHLHMFWGCMLPARNPLFLIIQPCQHNQRTCIYICFGAACCPVSTHTKVPLRNQTTVSTPPVRVGSAVNTLISPHAFTYVLGLHASCPEPIQRSSFLIIQPSQPPS